MSEREREREKGRELSAKEEREREKDRMKENEREGEMWFEWERMRKIASERKIRIRRIIFFHRIERVSGWYSIEYIIYIYIYILSYIICKHSTKRFLFLNDWDDEPFTFYIRGSIRLVSRN